MDVGCFSIQLIDNDGAFNHSAMKYFMRATNMDKCGMDYSVVSILGKKESGKSTLLDYLFGTDFREIKTLKESALAAKGIWLAKCTNINTFTAVLDLQGTLEKESRQDGSGLKKQWITFALAISDIVLINMWCHDIGTQRTRDQYILKTVFEVWMHTNSTRIMTLVLIIRDKAKTSLQNLRRALKQDIQKILNNFPKPSYQKLNNFFRIEVVALSSYKEEKKLFKEQVATLRKLYPSIPSGRLDQLGKNSYPASEFFIGAQEIWNDINANKQLRLNSHRDMINFEGCKRISDEIFTLFRNDEEWLEIQRNMQNEMVPGLEGKIFMIFDKYLTAYDRRACFFSQDNRKLERKHLKRNLNQLISPFYQSKLKCMSAQKHEDYFAQKYARVERRSTRPPIPNYDRQCEVKLDHFIICNAIFNWNFEESITKTNYQSNERSNKVWHLWVIVALGLLGFDKMVILFRFFRYHYYIALTAFALFLGFILRR